MTSSQRSRLLSLPRLAFKQRRRSTLHLKTIIQSHLQTKKKSLGLLSLFGMDVVSIHDFDGVDLRRSISHTTVRHGSKVYVEYPAEAWSYEKWEKDAQTDAV